MNKGKLQVSICKSVNNWNSPTLLEGIKNGSDGGKKLLVIPQQSNLVTQQFHS